MVRVDILSSTVADLCEEVVGSEAALATYPAEVIDGEVVVVLPPPVRTLSMREMLLAHARGEA